MNLSKIKKYKINKSHSVTEWLLFNNENINKLVKSNNIFLYYFQQQYKNMFIINKNNLENIKKINNMASNTFEEFEHIINTQFIEDVYINKNEFRIHIIKR